MAFDAALLNSQNDKVGIKSKVDQSREMELCPLLHLGVVGNEKGDIGSLLTTVPNFAFFTYIYIYIYIVI